MLAVEEENGEGNPVSGFGDPEDCYPSKSGTESGAQKLVLETTASWLVPMLGVDHPGMPRGPASTGFELHSRNHRVIQGGVSEPLTSS